MKKVLFFIIILTLTVETSLANTVSLEEAQKRAELFFNGINPKTKTSSVTNLVWTVPEVGTKSTSSAPLLYVFENESGGYVVIAGEDVAYPILGYSVSDSFPVGDIPDNMKCMLEWYADILCFARQNHWIADKEVSNEWDRESIDGSEDKTVRLETAKWGQGAPYNDLCPVIDGRKCPTGCVATAIAIIMRYHEWPRRGTGRLDTYSFGWNGEEYEYEIKGYNLGHEYIWEEMPLKPSYVESQTGYTESQTKQISQLMYDIGVMVHMGYSPNVSVSDGQYVVGLAKHFGYDKNIKKVGRGGYADSEWERLIKKDIDESRPVLYQGGSRSGSYHAFVIDGYIGRFFSINYGWGGSSFYRLTPLSGYEDELFDFYRSQTMFNQIQPDTGSEYEINAWVKTSSLTWDFVYGTSFKMYYSLGLNIYDYSSFKPMELSVWLFDHDLKPKEMISEKILSINKSKLRKSSSATGIIYAVDDINFTCCIKSPVNQGDRIHLCMLGKQGDWIPILPILRSQSIEFSLIPISELISIGYTCESPFLDNSNFWDLHNGDSRPTFYLYGYKELFWELKGVDNSVVRYSKYSGDSVVFHHEDQNGNVVHYFFFFDLPLGTYRLTLRNINEEVVIDICL